MSKICVYVTKVKYEHTLLGGSPCRHNVEDRYKRLHMSYPELHTRSRTEAESRSVAAWEESKHFC